MKFIVISGGVISGLGKGITASSIGLLLKECGYYVTAIKIDPYLNVDAGTMSPFEHGEVFVLEDGTETDLDLGNYERFLDVKLQKEHNITGGRVYKEVIESERRGEYLGQTVQVVPHVIDKIKSMIESASNKTLYDNNTPEVCIIELGGTVGDMESMHFIESLRQMNYGCENHDFCFIHVSMIINNNGEDKTKPTQASVSDLRRLGIMPDILVLRCSSDISEETRNKISLQCQVNKQNIFSNVNVENIYQVPICLKNQNMVNVIENVLKLERRTSIKIDKGIEYINNVIKNTEDKTKLLIGILGKYTNGIDTYLSVHRATEHAAYFLEVGIKIVYINSDLSEITTKENIIQYDAIIIPGGFGSRGTEGMKKVAEICRYNNIPMLGICLGMQIMCIEAACKILGNNCVSSENTQELKDISDYHSIIVPMHDLEWKKLGGTMRLGTYTTTIDNNMSMAYKIYNSNDIKERHRHRYEVNPKYINIIEQNGLIFSGKNNEIGCVDIIEDPKHPFYIGCQYHPEFQSTNNKPSPLFISLIKAIKTK